MKVVNPCVLSLDAGGTNFVFSAIRNGVQFGEIIRKPSHGDNLEKSLESIVDGFEELSVQVKGNFQAISFAFPGPADYERGIIGDLGNLPGYRGGVALGPLLEKKFNVPVFINNDGDLFAFGEACDGALPQINQWVKEHNGVRKYENLIGLTLGTGFGLGVVNNGELLRGDNSMPAEVWLLRNFPEVTSNIEEAVSIRAIIRTYHQESKTTEELTPLDIYKIAKGEKQGNKQAALHAYEKFGLSLGDAVASLISLFDANVVIGGGLSGAADLFMPHVFKAFETDFISPEGNKLPRLVHKVFNLNNPDEIKAFALGNQKTIQIPGTTETLVYDNMPRVGIMMSQIGTSNAITLGAYHYAISKL